MSRPTVLALAAVAAAAVAVVPAAAADAPVVGRQTTWTAASSPVTVPGAHLHRGDRIPAGAVLVLRRVRVPAGARPARLRLTLPGRHHLLGIATPVSGGADVQLAPGQTTRYVGRRSIALIVRDRGGRAGTATVYAYGR